MKWGESYFGLESCSLGLQQSALHIVHIDKGKNIQKNLAAENNECRRFSVYFGRILHHTRSKRFAEKLKMIRISSNFYDNQIFSHFSSASVGWSLSTFAASLSENSENCNTLERNWNRFSISRTHKYFASLERQTSTHFSQSPRTVRDRMNIFYLSAADKTRHSRETSSHSLHKLWWENLKCDRWKYFENFLQFFCLTSEKVWWYFEWVRRRWIPCVDIFQSFCIGHIRTHLDIRIV